MKSLNWKLVGGVNDYDSYFQFSLRPLFHDFLNKPDGYAPNSEFLFLSFDFRKYNQLSHPVLHQFSFIKLSSFVPYERINKSMSYHFNLGVNTEFYNKKPHNLLEKLYYNNLTANLSTQDYPEVRRILTPTLDVLFGYSLKETYEETWLSPFTLTGLLGARVQNSTHFNSQPNRVAPQAMLSLLWNYSDFRMQLVGRYFYYSLQVQETDIMQGTLNLGFNLNTNLETKVSLVHERNHREALISLRYYF